MDQASAATIGPGAGGSSSPPWRRWQAPSSPRSRSRHASGAAEPGRLIATVGPDFTIRIDDANGQRVQSVPEGAYTLLVRIFAEHNCPADMPAGLKLRVDSGGKFVGEKTFEIR